MYSYICPRCDREQTHLTFCRIGDKLPEPCDYCSSPYVVRAVCRISTARETPEHFNVSTGKVVSNKRSFKSQLSEQSDVMSDRLGYDVKYSEVDPGDKKALGVTTDGMGEALSKESNPVKRQHVDRLMS